MIRRDGVFILSTMEPHVRSSPSLSYDCDCACDYEPTYCPTVATEGALEEQTRWMRVPDLVEIALNGDHLALFDPLGTGGVVVVNRNAYAVLDCFQEPRIASEAELQWSSAPQIFRTAYPELVSQALLCDSTQPRIPQFGESRQLTAWLHLTGICNLQCPFCYVAKAPHVMRQSIGQTAIDALIQSAISHHLSGIKLKYSGGEPTLVYPLALKLHHYAQEHTQQAKLDFEAVILSNGTQISREMAVSLRDNRIKVMISLDGVGRVHDTQRPAANGQSSFDRVRQSIDFLVAAGHPPHLSITLTSRNLAGLPEVIRFVRQYRLTFSLNFFRDNECTSAAESLRDKEQQMIAALREGFSALQNNLPEWSLLSSLLDRGTLNQPSRKPCGVEWNYVAITPVGDVAKCHMRLDHTVGSLLSSDPLALIRAGGEPPLNPPVEDKSDCRSCVWRYWCRGGCPLTAYNAHGHFDCKSPYCRVYRAIFPEVIKLEGYRLLKRVEANQ